MCSLDVVSSEVASRPVNWHIGLQGIQPDASIHWNWPLERSHCFHEGLKIDCPCYFLLVLSADLGNPLFIFEIINCLTSVWFYLWMFWMNPLNVLSSEVALRLVNRHIGPQGVQLTALLVCSGGSFHERTEVVLRKVTLLSKKLMFVIIYLYSLEVDLTKLSVCLKRIL